MLNFIYGALAMWFVLGAIIYYFVEHTKKQQANWSPLFLIAVTFPYFIVAFPIALIIEICKEIKFQLWFNWEHDWKWKLEAIKEKIKHRY